MTILQDIDKTIEQSFISRIQYLSSPLVPKPTNVSENLTPLKNIQVILFDVYGTLFISRAGDISIASEMSNQQACIEALRAAGFSGDLEEAGAKGSKGLLDAIKHTHATRHKQGISYPEVDIREEWKKVLSKLHEAGLLKGDITSEAIQAVSVEYECRINPVWPMPEALSTLQKLWEKHFILGIVSNAQFNTLLMFPALFRKSYEELGFDPTLCAWSFRVQEVKPSFTMFRGVVKRLEKDYGISPEETLYVGNDMLNDIWTASQCGLKTALFAGDQRSLRLRENDPMCTGLKPDVIITQLSQLLECLSV